MYNKIPYLVILVLLIATQFATSNTAAKEITDIPPEELKQMPQSQLAKAFYQNRININGQYEPEKLSKGRALRSLLRAIGNHKGRLSVEDYNKLLEQSSKQKALAQQQHIQMVKKVQSLCAAFNYQSRELEVVHFAKSLSKLANKVDESAKKYYQSVINTLSAQGKAYIADEVIPAKLSNTVHSTVDLVAVAEQYPQAIRVTFEDICSRSKYLDIATQIDKTTVQSNGVLGTIITTSEFEQTKGKGK